MIINTNYQGKARPHDEHSLLVPRPPGGRGFGLCLSIWPQLHVGHGNPRTFVRGCL